MGIKWDDADLMAEMYKRQVLIADTLGIILVTCGQCGGILLAKNDDYTGDEDYSCEIGHKCPCGFCGDVCDFPDYFLPPE